MARNTRASGEAGTAEPQSSRFGRPDLIVLAILLLLPVVFYAKMIFQGMEPTAPDIVAHRPVAEWAKQATRDLGTVPEWFPFYFGGMPSYGSFLHIPRAVCNPLAQILQLFEGNRGVRYALLLAVAGLGTFVLLRRQGFSRVASTSGALYYSFTPYFAGVIAAGHSTKLEALAIVPAFLAAFDALLQRPGPFAAALLALTGAILAWANHPQIAYYAVLVAGLYAVARAVKDKERRKLLPWALWTGAAGILAVLLVAEPYLAIREYTPHSIRGAASALAGAGAGAGVGWEYATGWSFAPRELISFLFPGWFGLEGETYWGPLPFTQSTHYFGVFGLALAVIGVWLGRTRYRWIWAGIGLFLLFVGFGNHLPLLYRPMYEVLPLFDRFRVPSMIYALLPLALAYLVATGLDHVHRWSAGAPARSPKGKRDPRVTRAGAVLAVTAVLWIVFVLGASVSHSDPASLLKNTELGQVPPETAAILAATRRHLLLESVNFSFLWLFLGVALVGLSLIKAQWRTPLFVGLAVILVADIWRVSLQFYEPNPVLSVEDSIPVAGAAHWAASQDGEFRIVPAGAIFGTNSFAALEVESIGGYQPAKLRVMQDLIDSNALFAPGVLQMLNVRFALSPRPMGSQTPVYSEDGYVFALPPGPGTTWSVPNVQSVPNAPAMLDRLTDGSFDPKAIAFVYPEDAGNLPDQLAPAEIREFSRGLHEVRFTVSAPGSAFVVSSEIYYAPGWTATIDGQPAKIVRTNHVLRGLLVPAGDHEVVFRWTSTTRQTGARISRIAGVLWLGLFGSGWWLRRRDARKEQGA